MGFRDDRLNDLVGVSWFEDSLKTETESAVLPVPVKLGTEVRLSVSSSRRRVGSDDLTGFDIVGACLCLEEDV